MNRLSIGSGKLFWFSLPGGGGAVPPAPPVPSGAYIMLETLTDNLVTEGGDKLITE